MRILPIIAAAVAAISPLHAQEQAKANELSVRGGLPNFFDKLKKGEEVRVGYLGGSITAANGWRVKSLKWLKEQYPDAKLSEINATIGGTGSDLGVFRADQDVISKKPDLLFVEFAVNDGGPAEKVQRCMEGIVRQTWKADPTTDICFVYTLSEPMLPAYKDGKFTTVATAMEGVADHYRIPSIAFGPEVTKQVLDGSLIFTGKPDPAKPGQRFFTGDAVHPNDTGHEVYQTVIARSLTAMKDSGTGGPHKLAGMEPLRADNWENAKIVPITQSMLKGKWTKQDPTQPGPAKTFHNRVPELWKAEEPGASIEFILEGTVAQVYGLVGPDGGEVEIKVDELAPKKALLFDKYCTYHRLGKMDLFSAPSADRHTISVTLTANMPDKAKILSEENRKKMEANPEPYAKAVWYAGSLLVLGDVAE
ncbi:MAG: SGNH/GDSL hydrolase family protein [Akkermansiaceae bacterium]|nr:SGNH/GDSL hydrolase family protein [Akkermansiaceae bacterium]